MTKEKGWGGCGLSDEDRGMVMSKKSSKLGADLHDISEPAGGGQGRSATSSERHVTVYKPLFGCERLAVQTS